MKQGEPKQGEMKRGEMKRGEMKQIEMKQGEMKQGEAKKRSRFKLKIAAALLLALLLSAGWLIFDKLLPPAGFYDGPFRQIDYDLSRARILTEQQYQQLHEKMYNSSHPLDILGYDYAKFKTDSYLDYWIKIFFGNFSIFSTSGFRNDPGFAHRCGERGVDFVYSDRKDDFDLRLVRNLKLSRVCALGLQFDEYKFLQYNDLSDADVYLWVSDVADCRIFNFLKTGRSIACLNWSDLPPKNLSQLQSVSLDGVVMNLPPPAVFDYLPPGISYLCYFGSEFDFAPLRRLKKLDRLNLCFNSISSATVDLRNFKGSRLEILSLAKIRLELPKRLEYLTLGSNIELAGKVKVGSLRVNLGAINDFSFLSSIDTDELTVAYELYSSIIGFSSLLRKLQPASFKRKIFLLEYDLTSDLKLLKPFNFDRLDIRAEHKKQPLAPYFSSGVKEVRFINKTFKMVGGKIVEQRIYRQELFETMT